jgi:hypothetical protein
MAAAAAARFQDALGPCRPGAGTGSDGGGNGGRTTRTGRRPLRARLAAGSIWTSVLYAPLLRPVCAHCPAQSFRRRWLAGASLVMQNRACFEIGSRSGVCAGAALALRPLWRAPFERAGDHARAPLQATLVREQLWRSIPRMPGLVAARRRWRVYRVLTLAATVRLPTGPYRRKPTRSKFGSFTLAWAFRLYGDFGAARLVRFQSRREKGKVKGGWNGWA